MISGKRIAVVMAAFNAEETLPQTVREIPETVDIKILVDDSSSDRTLSQAVTIEGDRVAEYAREFGLGFECGIPQGMKKLGEAINPAGKRESDFAFYGMWKDRTDTGPTSATTSNASAIFGVIFGAELSPNTAAEIRRDGRHSS